MRSSRCSWMRWSATLAVLTTLLGSALLPGSAAAQQPGPSPKPYDLTDNGVVDAGDVGAAIDRWKAAQTGDACAADAAALLDLDGSGCLDIADVQQVAARWGQLADPRVAVPEGTPEGSGAVGAAAIRTFTVNSNGDGTDANPGNDVCETGAGNGVCTLRAAIREAVAEAGHDTIRFDIRPGGSCPNAVQIVPGSALIIDDPAGDGVTIDGYSQCNAAPNTQSVGSNSSIRIEIRGTGALNSTGLEIRSAKNIIRGLSIYDFGYAMKIVGVNGDLNRIEGNYLGTNIINTFTAPATGIRTYGLSIDQGAQANIVGGTTPDARNVLYGSRESPVSISGTDTRNNRVIGNYLGLKKDGVTPFGGGGDGVDIDCGPQYNSVGGFSASERNVILSDRDGIEISHCSPTKFNAVIGNFIGINALGNPVGNSLGTGVTLEDNAGSTTISDNVIGNMGSNGIRLAGMNSDNIIQYNWIGQSPDGKTALPNGRDPASIRGRHGIYISGGGQRNLIANNLIANNPQHGIYMDQNVAPENDSDGNADGFAATRENRITRNRIFNNVRKSIFLNPTEYPSGSGTQVFPNDGLRGPGLVTATTAVVAGTSRTLANTPCAGCTIEIFIAAPQAGEVDGEGYAFIADGQTDSAGNFSIPICGKVAPGQLLTATATDSNGNTSYFSNNKAVSAGSCATSPQEPRRTDLRPRGWMPLSGR